MRVLIVHFCFYFENHVERKISLLSIDRHLRIAASLMLIFGRQFDKRIGK